MPKLKTPFSNKRLMTIIYPVMTTKTLRKVSISRNSLYLRSQMGYHQMGRTEISTSVWWKFLQGLETDVCPRSCLSVVCEGSRLGPDQFHSPRSLYMSLLFSKDKTKSVLHLHYAWKRYATSVNIFVTVLLSSRHLVMSRVKSQQLPPKLQCCGATYP